MRTDSCSRVAGDPEEEGEEGIQGQRTSRDFDKDFDLAVGDSKRDTNNEKEATEASRAQSAIKRKRSDSEDDDSHVDKKLKESEVSDLRNQWKEVMFLGRGGFGSVQLMEKNSSGFLCARKTVQIRRLERQLKEVEIHRKLEHENIIAFLGEIIDEDYLYIYLEYASGGTLRQRISDKGVPEDEARYYFVQLIQGLKYVHSLHVTHRDLKPENLLLARKDVLKIGDFELACEFVEGEYLSRTCGTTAYIAPEVFARRYKGQQADIWSCGIILFELLTGRSPWRRAQSGDSDFEIWSSAVMLEATAEMRKERRWESLSEESFALFEKLLVPDPEERATLPCIDQDAWIQG
ncbi:serine/threonine-protein kinase Chk1-like [Oratosquilla oratoria]|uniref:serine/threonine-protein kinase Chk1-like n=1 Tax=Oratosquilla oratoria TaxID=337810 RepID=UPI003F75FD64